MRLTVMGCLWQAREMRELPAPHAGVVDVQYPSNHSVDFTLKPEAIKRCRLSLLTNSAPRKPTSPNSGGRGGGMRGLSQWVQLCTSRDMEPIDPPLYSTYAWNQSPWNSHRQARNLRRSFLFRKLSYILKNLFKAYTTTPPSGRSNLVLLYLLWAAYYIVIYVPVPTAYWSLRAEFFYLIRSSRHLGTMRKKLSTHFLNKRNKELINLFNEYLAPSKY